MVTLCHGVRVKGRFRSSVLNAGALTSNVETVTVFLPLLVKVTGKVAIWPVTMLPNQSLPGLQVSCYRRAWTTGTTEPSKRVTTSKRKRGDFELAWGRAMGGVGGLHSSEKRSR